MRAPADLIEKRRRANETLDRIDVLLDRCLEAANALTFNDDGDRGDRRDP